MLIKLIIVYLVLEWFSIVFFPENFRVFRWDIWKREIE